MKRFKKVSWGLHLSHKERSFFRWESMYMNGTWNYNHEYFQRMIDRDSRMNAEVVGCIITGISELNNDDFSSDSGTMPSLQNRGQDDWFSNDGTDSYGEDGMYNNVECWGYKARTLKQIISNTQGGMFLASDTPTLYAFSLHRYAKVNVNSVLHNGATECC